MKAAQQGFWHLARFLAGWAFIGLGIVGLFVPILQGILFLAVGTALLAPYIPFFRRLRNHFYRRFPGLRDRIQAWKRALRGERRNQHGVNHHVPSDLSDRSDSSDQSELPR